MHPKCPLPPLGRCCDQSGWEWSRAGRWPYLRDLPTSTWASRMTGVVPQGAEASSVNKIPPPPLPPHVTRASSFWGDNVYLTTA